MCVKENLMNWAVVAKRTASYCQTVMTTIMKIQTAANQELVGRQTSSFTEVQADSWSAETMPSRRSRIKFLSASYHKGTDMHLGLAKASCALHTAKLDWCQALNYRHMMIANSVFMSCLAQGFSVLSS